MRVRLGLRPRCASMGLEAVRTGECSRPERGESIESINQGLTGVMCLTESDKQ